MSINHEEAMLFATTHREDSNLARCYLQLREELEAKNGELLDLYDGKKVILPSSSEHARSMGCVAESYLRR